MNNEQKMFKLARKETPKNDLYLLSRRDLLKQSLVVSASMVVGSGFIAASSASWALEVKALKPETMATLIQMARDIYPHDRFSDDLYAAALKGHDDKAAEDEAFKSMIETGVDSLNKAAADAGSQDYLSVGWEVDRVTLLKAMESDEFFQTIRGGLVVGLYNQKPVWEILGYEGSSFEKGGYINRGFDDITWL